MSEGTSNIDLLSALRDLGVPDPLPDNIDVAVRLALTRAIYSPVDSPPKRFGSLRRALRQIPLIPAGLIMTTAVAAAATGIATGVLNLNAAAQKNVNDTPLKLFQADLPAKSGATPASLWDQTVIPSTVHVIATRTIPGIGKVRYWVADTRQNGICTAIQLPGGTWAGLRNFKQVGGSLVGCRPTRAQLSRGALILSGFDYTDSVVLTDSGKPVVFDYGEITAPGASKVRDAYSGATTSVIERRYFLLIVKSVRGKDAGLSIVETDLAALNAAGKVIADERKPLAGTPTTRCVGRYNVRHIRVPGTKRTELMYDCRRFVHTPAR